MVLNRVFRAGKRSNCHLALLNAIAGSQNRSVYGASKFLRNGTRPRLQQIRFSSQFRQPEELAAEESEEKLVDELENENENGHDDFEALTSVLDDAGSSDESLPWYLQDQAPESPKRPLSERQLLPELPENAPPILDPLIKQISVDLGLDDLTLLDLRALYPPPALGANLIMLLGTARSERHLHVSADRLCRWLRSEYKLRPDADGLLGRAELKLKLRRKARRAKLTGNGTVDENADDGVRTGWVCVNVGTVESPATAEVEKPQGFVGFGRRTEGVKIVVQMLTEDKRDELDLEHLWDGILRRSGPEAESDKAYPVVSVHGQDTNSSTSSSST